MAENEKNEVERMMENLYGLKLPRAATPRRTRGTEEGGHLAVVCMLTLAS